jgi:putative ABC transport system permease protein
VFDALARDLKLALRVFRQSPAFAIAAVAALTLGIGSNTAIFSVVNAVLLRPAAFPDPDRIVIFMNASPQGTSQAASPAKFQHYRSQTSVVQDVAALDLRVVNYTGGNEVEQLRSGRVSADFFRLFGARLVRGRTFAPQEDLPLGPRVAVLGHRFWVTRFDSNPDVIGQTISLGGEPYTIIGVLADFEFSEFGPTPQVWTPFQLDPNSTDQGHYFLVAGRLRPGVTLAQAVARMQVSASEFRAKFPNALGPNAGFTVQPVRDALVRNARSSLLIIAGAVSFVLLIACANVANLLLARATARRRELAIRAAIGGSRWTIARQLLTESVVLSVAGGACGLFVGWAGIHALLAVNTAGLPRVGEAGALVGIDWTVAAFTLLVSVATGIVFGLIPAYHASRVDVATTLKEGGDRAGTGFRQNVARSLLVVTEVSLAVVLLVGSALLIRTAVALARVDPGFDPRNVLTMKMSMTGPQFQRSDAVEQLVRTGVERLRGVPGVELATATCCVPLEGGYGLPFTIVGRPLDNGPYHGGGRWTTISPGYFEVFRIPIRRGRTINERDDRHGPPVVIVNEAMARQYFPKADPLGARLVIGRGVMREFADEPVREIVGIVGDTRDGALNSDPQPTMYIPQAQVPDAANALNMGLAPTSWVVRLKEGGGTLAVTVQEELRKVTGLPVSDVRMMDEVVSRSTSRQRFNMWLMTVFGCAALLLAAIGIYGLMAYSVEQRTQELGIRLALGAPTARVQTMVLLQGLRLAGAGVVVGLAASLGLARLMSTILFGVTARDPLVFVAVPLVLVAVAALAVWLPARRASRVDPIIALRV